MVSPVGVPTPALGFIRRPLGDFSILLTASVIVGNSCLIAIANGSSLSPLNSSRSALNSLTISSAV